MTEALLPSQRINLERATVLVLDDNGASLDILSQVVAGFGVKQMHRAESDPAVAAASVLARAEFVRRLDALSRDAGVRLPKGASAAVDAVARALVHSRGREALSAFAKVHVKNAQRVGR